MIDLLTHPQLRKPDCLQPRAVLGGGTGAKTAAGGDNTGDVVEAELFFYCHVNFAVSCLPTRVPYSKTRSGASAAGDHLRDECTSSIIRFRMTSRMVRVRDAYRTRTGRILFAYVRDA